MILANCIMTWSWFFSRLLIMKNTCTGYAWLPGKKKCSSFKVFKTTNYPQKPHGHKMKQIWSLIRGAFKHSPSEKLSFRLSFWDKQSIHEKPDLKLPRKQYRHTSTGLSFNWHNFLQEPMVLGDYVLVLRHFFSSQ